MRNINIKSAGLVDNPCHIVYGGNDLKLNYKSGISKLALDKILQLLQLTSLEALCIKDKIYTHHIRPFNLVKQQYRVKL